jgi:YVTN family beta-propeller protein
MRRLALAAVLAMTSAPAEPTDISPPPPQGLLLVVNKGDQTLGLIDPGLGSTVAAVKLSGYTGHEVAASPDGKTAYVPIYGDSGVGRAGSDGRAVDVIDIPSRQRTATIDLGQGERPHCAQVGPDGLLYVSTEVTNSVTVIDPKALKVVGKLPTGEPQSHMVVISPDGKRAYTSNVRPGSVTVIDIASRNVLATIPVSRFAQRIALAQGLRVITADQTEPRLAVIDTLALKVDRFVTLPALAFSTAPTPDGRRLVMTMPAANKVALLDLATWEVTKTFDVPKAPQEVLIRPDGLVAYVSCDAAAKVVEIDLVAEKVSRLLDAGAMADGLAWAAGAR